MDINCSGQVIEISGQVILLNIFVVQNVQQCSTYQVVVSGGQAPYTLSLVSGTNYNTVLGVGYQRAHYNLFP